MKDQEFQVLDAIATGSSFDELMSIEEYFDALDALEADNLIKEDGDLTSGYRATEQGMRYIKPFPMKMGPSLVNGRKSEEELLEMSPEDIVAYEFGESLDSDLAGDDLDMNQLYQA